MKKKERAIILGDLDSILDISFKYCKHDNKKICDAAQKIKARKDHLLVDRLGLIPGLSVQAADRPDPDRAKWGLPKIALTATGLTLIGVDGGYGGKLMAWGQDICG